MGVVQFLLAQNLAVQLEHRPEETSRTDHGFVHIKTLGGIVLAESADFQHNRNNQTSKDISSLLKGVLEHFDATPGATIVSPQVDPNTTPAATSAAAVCDKIGAVGSSDPSACVPAAAVGEQSVTLSDQSNQNL